MNRLRNLIGRRRLRREAAEEVASHLEERVDDLIESGLSAAEARQQAKREFGNVARIVEQSRDEWTISWLDEAVRDLRYGLRMLRKNPALAAVATLSLALGIGANTAIFSFIDAILLRSLPVRQPDSLVIVRALTRQGTRDSFSDADYQWLSEHNHIFSGLAAFAAWNLNLDLADRKEKLPGELVSGNYFSVLGVEPALGRMIAPEDDASPGSHPVAVISYAFWQRAYARNPNVVGQRLKFDHVALEIIGVAPRNFSGEYEGYSPDVWAPLAMQPQLNGGNSFLNTRNVSWLNSMGRLAPRVTLREARAGAPVLLNGLRNALHIDSQNDYLGSIGIQPGSGGISWLRDQYAQPLWILMALVALVLFIACANVANLLLVRSAARSREFAVRLAIGAGRSRLVRQLLTEALLLAVISCILGLALAYLMIHGLLAISQIDSLDVRLNLKVLGFAAFISSAAALAFGLAPALTSNRIDPWSTLKRDGRSIGDSARKLSPSRLLVIGQTAVSVVLLIASGLLLRTFLNLKLLNPGFDENHVVQVKIDASGSSMDGVTLGTTLAGRLSTVAGVQSASFSGFGFAEGTDRICCVDVEGYTSHQNEDKNVRIQSISPHYFATMGIPLLAGRDFAASDKPNAAHLAIVNETMARYYLADANPIGKRFTWSPGKPKDIEIIGVVKDAKYDNLRQQSPRMAYFLLHSGEPGPLQIRLTSNAGRPLSAIVQDCRAAIHSVDRHIAIRSIEPLTVAVDRTLHSERLVAQLSIGFGIVALLLTSIGLYGVLSYAVARRTSELGIRLALGAEHGDLLRMVMADGLALVLIGLVFGLFASYVLNGLLRNLLYGVQPHDALTFSIAACLLLAVAAIAIYGPARRATKVEPSAALRYE